MQQRMNLADLMDFFNSLTENGMRSAQWLRALQYGSNGYITRSFEGQTFTVLYLNKDIYEVTFK